MTNTPRRTIQAACVRGALKAHKMPGTTGAYLIDYRDLERWMVGRGKAAS